MSRGAETKLGPVSMCGRAWIGLLPSNAGDNPARGVVGDPRTAVLAEAEGE
jgi:hypothetical protein